MGGRSNTSKLAPHKHTPWEKSLKRDLFRVPHVICWLRMAPLVRTHRRRRRTPLQQQQQHAEVAATLPTAPQHALAAIHTCCAISYAQGGKRCQAATCKDNPVPADARKACEESLGRPHREQQLRWVQQASAGRPHGKGRPRPRPCLQARACRARHSRKHVTPPATPQPRNSWGGGSDSMLRAHSGAMRATPRQCRRHERHCNRKRPSDAVG